MGQLIALQSQDRWKENVKNTDVYIKVNVDGYNSASFNLSAIDTLIIRGEQAAMAKFDTLQLIGRKLNPQGKVTERPEPAYFSKHESPTAKQEKYLDILIGDTPQNSINLGLRFDNEELASLLFNTQMRFGEKQTHGLSLTARLGKKTYGRLDYFLHMGKQWYFLTGYQLTYNDFNIYEKGSRVSEINFLNHQTELSFYRSWKKLLLRFSGIYENYNYSSLLYSVDNNEPNEIDKEEYLKFGIQGTVNTLNHPYFPTKGNELRIGYHYVIPLHDNKNMFHAANLHWKAAISFNSRFTVMPRVECRYLTSENTLAEVNTLGGQEPGKYFSQQIPFYGINHFETAHSTLAIAGLELRQRIGSKHYVSGAFNVGLTSDDWLHFFKNSFGENEALGYDIWGGAIKYDLQTFMGPIGFAMHFSNRDKVSAYFRAGFNF